jgi:hypothetical protein
MARRSGKGEPRRPQGSSAEPEDILRAKYYDYCSARVCDVFLELEEERVFELAQAAEKRVGAVNGALNFQDLAALLVEQLLGDMALPDFDSWAEDYRRDPEKYEPYLLGFWKASLESPAASR